MFCVTFELTGALSRPGLMTCYAISKGVSPNVQRPMKDSQDIDIATSFSQVRNSVVAIQEDPNISIGRRVAMANFRMLQQHLGPFINSSDDPCCSLGIVFGDLVKDVFEPAL